MLSSAMDQRGVGGSLGRSLLPLRKLPLPPTRALALCTLPLPSPRLSLQPLRTAHCCPMPVPCPMPLTVPLSSPLPLDRRTERGLDTEARAYKGQRRAPSSTPRRPPHPVFLVYPQPHRARLPQLIPISPELPGPSKIPGKQEGEKAILATPAKNQRHRRPGFA
ncbi:hypothetical protein E2562_022766 [Oryza meyeriana var. granulata]|uniref:Uncharacterized protein n=1 Tax=Oryza meyeriana var. granulata TaxID=110450 RepID=A0A6G1FB38_9ORYZ|nr:hypothetical protein E2562_022766 [Oryza meyeriana var. granulata]